MTTYRYTITLDDSEAIMLSQVLPEHIKNCEMFLDKGAPYWAQRDACQSLLKKLDAAWDTKSQSSGYVPGKEEA